MKFEELAHWKTEHTCLPTWESLVLEAGIQNGAGGEESYKMRKVVSQPVGSLFKSVREGVVLRRGSCGIGIEMLLFSCARGSELD